MNFLALQDEVIALRFNANKRASIKSWLNLRYAAIWDKADWHFKHVKGTTLNITASDPTPAMPPEFAKSEGLYDHYGQPLTYLEPKRWRDIYFDTNVAATDPPCHYTVIDREIWLGPTPSASRNFTLSYLRRLCAVDAIAGVVGGVMVEDTDQPVWAAEYDYTLVLDACILGQQLEGDPTWQNLVQTRDELLASMIGDLVGGQQGEPEIWGEG